MLLSPPVPTVSPLSVAFEAVDDAGDVVEEAEERAVVTVCRMRCTIEVSSIFGQDGVRKNRCAQEWA